VDEGGVLHYQHVGAATADSGGSSKASTTTLLRFQLQYQPGEDAGLYEPIAKPWRFEFVPGMPGDLLLVQAGSCRILYASLPKRDSCASDVFLFGAHTGVWLAPGSFLLRFPCVLRRTGALHPAACRAWGHVHGMRDS
jgi:hypothetical protein